VHEVAHVAEDLTVDLASALTIEHAHDAADGVPREGLALEVEGLELAQRDGAAVVLVVSVEQLSDGVHWRRLRHAVALRRHTIALRGHAVALRRHTLTLRGHSVALRRHTLTLRRHAIARLALRRHTIALRRHARLTLRRGTGLAGLTGLALRRHTVALRGHAIARLALRRHAVARLALRRHTVALRGHAVALLGGHARLTLRSTTGTLLLIHFVYSCDIKERSGST